MIWCSAVVVWIQQNDISDYLQETYDEWILIVFSILASVSCHCLLLHLVSVLRCQQHSQQQYSNHIVVIIIITMKSLHVFVRVQKKRDDRLCSCEPCTATRCTGNADVSHVAYCCGSGHVFINIITQPVRLRKHGNLRQTTPREHQD